MRTDLAQPRIALIGFPTDADSSFLRGASEAPPRIREALRSGGGNLWTERGEDLEPALDDLGDVPVNPGTAGRAAIRDAVAGAIERNLSPLCLGGDQAVTWPAVEALHAVHGALDILQFDAHPDLYDEFLGSRSSHACTFARILEEGLARRLVQVGIRTSNGHQRRQAERFGVETLEMRAWREDWRPDVAAPLYVSIDLDVLDPGFAPGVSHREPGGCSPRQLIDVLQRIDGGVVGAEIVECNPRQDPSGLSLQVAAKLVKELASLLLRSP